MIRFLLLSIVFLLTSATSCDRESAFPRTQLRVEIKHHERSLADVDLQVYLNHLERPSLEELEDFDAKLTSDASGIVVLDGISLGNHYIVGIGYDPLIAEQVVGHMPLRFDRANLTVDTTLYVGEEDYFRID